MGFVQTLLDLILQPESSLKLIPAINVSVLLLLGVLCYLLYSNGLAVIHIYVMAFLAVGLVCSVNWFYIQFQKVKLEQSNATANTGSDNDASNSSDSSKLKTS